METKFYESRAGSVRLEIGGVGQAAYGSIFYEDSERRYAASGLDIVIRAVVAMLDALRAAGGGASLFLGPFQPAVPTDSPEIERARALYDAWNAALAGREAQEIGHEEPIAGRWMPADEGIALLRSFGPQCGIFSAEESHLRVLLLEREDPDANGWDLLHEDALTTLGRWISGEKPGVVDDPRSLEAPLEAARAALGEGA